MPKFLPVNLPNSPLGPVRRSNRERVDSIIKPPQPVIRRTMDLNPWLLLLVFILSVPVALWCYEHLLNKESTRPPVPAVNPALVEAVAPPPAPAPAPPAESAPPQPDTTSPPASTPPQASVLPAVLSPPPDVSPPPPVKPVAKPATNQIPDGFHRIGYAVFSNSNTVRVKYTDEQGKIVFLNTNSNWQHNVLVKNGATVVFGADLTEPGAVTTYILVELSRDGVVWKSDQSSGASASAQVSGVVSD